MAYLVSSEVAFLCIVHRHVKTESMYTYPMTGHHCLTATLYDFETPSIESFMQRVWWKTQFSIEVKIRVFVSRTPQVAAYDFVMPILINQTKAPTPASTPVPSSANLSRRSSIHIVNPRPQKAHIVTPRRHVIATALRQPLQLSTNQIEIALPCDFFEMAKASGIAHSKVWSFHVIILH